MRRPQKTRSLTRSEHQLQTQLDRAAASRSNDRIGCGPIGRGTTAAKAGAENRGIVHAKSVLSTERICEVRMVENVEELGSELGSEALLQPPALRNREIPIAKTGIAKRVAAHGTEGAECWGKHSRLAIRTHVAAEGVQGRVRPQSRGATSAHGRESALGRSRRSRWCEILGKQGEIVTRI